MRFTLGVALGACALTALFLALVIERRPVARRTPSPEPIVASRSSRDGKTPPPAKVERNVVEVHLMVGWRHHTPKAHVELVSATDPSLKYTQVVTGGVHVFTNIEPGQWYVTATTASHAAPARIVQSGEKPTRVELQLERAGKIRGAVFDAEGKPLREARVAARELVGTHGSRAPREALTNTDGAFEFAFLAPGKYELIASADAWEPTSRQVEVKAGETTATEATIFRLTPVKWGTIRGLVLDAEGKPVGEASVRAQPGECRILRQPGPDGVFELEAPPGRVVLAADAPGYAMEVRDDIVVLKGGEENVEFRLGRGAGVIEGRVLLGSGDPAAGALVECVQGSGEPGEASRGTVASVRTDARGRFLLRGFVEGLELGIRVSATGHPSTDVGVVKVPQRDLEYVIGEVRYAVLGGRVTTAEAPAGDVRYELKLWRVADTGGRRLVGVYTADAPSTSRDPRFQAREGGEFLFDRLMPGTYALAVSAPGFAPTEVGPLVVPADAQLTGLAVRLGKGLSISGRVLGTSGRAKIAGVRVTVLDASGESVAPEVETDAEGVFVVPNIGPGSYVLVFRHEAYRETRKEVRVAPGGDVTNLPVTMDDTPTLLGKVVDADGKPVESGTVVAMREGERREGKVKDGAYEIRGLLGGVYLLWAASPGHGQTRVPDVSVAADGRTVRDLRLSPGGTLRITVRAGEMAIVGARAALRWKDGTEVGELSFLDGAGEPAEATDAHGVLVLLNVPSDPLVLRVTKGGTTREIEVCVPEGATLAIPVGWAE